ncbi:NAD(P)-binding domain-containing protein [Neobacillus sp. PS3-34]|uniref:NAD(P)-binding domain-containing protein n=1 Tax=Neobacillus sp. PS3-34 TaxID=3070678 RepID=UPI0027E08BBA|nr:NAD(P)-binding domain-containing protein [Neobacillus sp. PS3-34]WML49721.1 NAD(P)-binding domain-containing protein [Neobacillus sp. PS3-34]
MLDLIIIGSGPFGISLASHAVSNNLQYKLFGYPMDFWRNQMPQDMFIRTPHEFVSFSDSKDDLTIQQFSIETGIELVTPLPRPIFVQYANWFARKSGVEFTPEKITKVIKNEGYYEVTSETGDQYTAKNVVVATGVEHYKYLPGFLRELPSQLVSHTSGYTSFSQFKGKKVVVVGSGQSAWEAAGLLHRDGADVELVYRKEGPNYAGSRENEIALRDVGDIFYQLPLDEKKQGWGQSAGSVAHFLKPYVEGIVPQNAGVSIEKVELLIEDEIRIVLSDGSEKIVNHIIAATGFRINLDQVPFFEKDLLSIIEREEGFTEFPKLNESFESSLPGLYFARPLSSHSHGPTFRFILGLRKTAFSIIPSIVKNKEHNLIRN